MKTSSRGILALIRHEGIVPAPYLDVRGIWTFGIGHTAKAGEPFPADMLRGMPANIDVGIRRAFAVFRADLASFEGDVNKALRVPVEQHQFDALVSFHYNTGGIFRANLVDHINAGDMVSAGAGFMGWSKPDAIIPRRKAERALFETGEYPQGPLVVWGADARGRVQFRKPHTLLTEDAALALLTPAPKPAIITKPRPWWAGLLDALIRTFRR